MNVSLGTDPGKPGRYPLTKALVDSDLDGIVSAAMVRLVYPEIEIIQGNATAMTKGEYDNIIDNTTLIIDLKYKKGCGLYLDHHESNKPADENFPGRWRNTDSASRVVYDYYKEYTDLSKFETILNGVDKFDSGKVSLNEYLNPDNLLKLGCSIDRKDELYNALLIEYLAIYEFEQVCNNNLIKKKVDLSFEKRDEVFNYIKKHTKILQGIAVIDVSKYTGQTKMTGYMLTSQFPDINFVLVFKKASSPDEIKIRLYRNNFNNNSKKFNLLKIAQSINPDAGGHLGACGFAEINKHTKEEIINLTIEKIKNPEYWL